MFHVSFSFTFTLDCLLRSSGSFIFRVGANCYHDGLIMDKTERFAGTR